MDPGAYQLLRQAVDAWEELDARRTRLPGNPLPGSLWAADLARAPLPGPYARIYAGTSIHSALDHLMAWRQIVWSGLIPVLAHWVLARTIVECAERTLWLIDPSIATSDRVARGIAARLEDQEERRKFERLQTAEDLRARRPETFRTAEERKVEIKAKAVADGIPVIGYKDNTALLRDAGLEWLYRLASGYAHGFEWNSVGSTMVPVPGVSGPGMAGGIMSANDDILAGVAAIAESRARRAVEALERYHR